MDAIRTVRRRYWTIIPLFLLQDADQEIRRAGLLIEQHRLHMLLVHRSQRDAEQRKLKGLIAVYTRLLNYR
jgi:hypothetical protein